ncbi:hypothetical protein D3C74_319230 [compost metagenome]
MQLKVKLSEANVSKKGRIVMYYIKDARFSRITEIEGIPCAEIIVSPGAALALDLYVYIARSAAGEQYEIIKMLKSDASLGIDWFDNSMHQAFEVIKEEDFGDEGWPEPSKQREQFKQNLLAHSVIAARLNSELPPYAKNRQIKPL